MGGAVVFTGKVRPSLNFPLAFDHVRVSRYGDDDQSAARSGQSPFVDNAKEAV